MSGSFSFRPIAVGVLLIAATAASAFASVHSAHKQTWSHEIDPNGNFVLINETGNLDVIGTDDKVVKITAVRVIRGLDEAALAEGRSKVEIVLSGNQAERVVRTRGQTPAGRAPRWTSAVNFTIEIPRTINLDITNLYAEGVRIRDISGRVNLKNVMGKIQLVGLRGEAIVDTINGDIFSSFNRPPQADLRLSTVNGQIELRIPRSSQFRWFAQSMRGDILSNMPVQVKFDSPERSLLANVNGSRPWVKVETVAMTGRVFLIDYEQPSAPSRSLIPTRLRIAETEPVSNRGSSTEVTETLNRIRKKYLIQPPSARTFARHDSLVQQDFEFSTTLGNVLVGEILGNARIFTRAGEIILGLVEGRTEVKTGGGPINLGDIGGPLVARTSAGDISVRAARKGGDLATDGGNVQVTFNGGPLAILSGGGDIAIRNTVSRVRAETRSGDISINVDKSVRTEQVDAKTIGGNIFLNVPTGFAADIDATIVTSEESANAIRSELSGLSILREKAGDRVRIRATGKFNGGGKPVQLYAEDGDIRITTQNVP